MSTIYLVQQGGVVTRKQSRFQIKVADEPQQDIPVREISKLLLYGNIGYQLKAKNLLRIWF